MDNAEHCSRRSLGLKQQYAENDDETPKARSAPKASIAFEIGPTDDGRDKTIG
jgi:hypothetical protein